MPRAVVEPLAPERYRVQFTVGKETREKLRRAQELLSREIPDGDAGAIFDRALTLLLEDVAKKKLAATPKPRTARPTAPGSRHIPASVRRAVWVRDGGRCTFVAKIGRRCSQRRYLEVHHRNPHALGGEATVENCCLLCRVHNVYEAEIVFGPYAPAVVREGSTPYAASVRQGSGARRRACSGTTWGAANLGRRKAGPTLKMTVPPLTRDTRAG